jgi:TonB family protein
MAVMHSEPDLNRLYAALLFSTVLHVVLAYAYLGSAGAPEPMLSAPDAAHVLTARLYAGDAQDLSAQLARPQHTKTDGSSPSADDTANEDQDRPLAQENQFFAASLLTKRPRPKYNVDLNIPEAKILTKSGSVILSLQIDNQGKVVSVKIEKTDLPDEFAAAAAATFGKARFEPGEIYGHAVGSIIKIEITHDSEAPLEQ